MEFGNTEKQYFSCKRSKTGNKPYKRRSGAQNKNPNFPLIPKYFPSRSGCLSNPSPYPFLSQFESWSGIETALDLSRIIIELRY